MLHHKLKIKTLLFGVLFSTGFVLIPHSVYGASVYLNTDAKTISVGDTIIVNVFIDPLDKAPNVVEGNILISSSSGVFNISEANTAGTVLNYWAQSPAVEDGSKVSFIGGKPGGLNEAGLLFKIILSAQSVGQVTISPINIKAYNNDSKSTPIEVTSNDLTLNIKTIGTSQPKNEWLETISKDDKPPQQLSAVVGQDDSVSGGKKFITLFATDNESGLSRFEVKEGSWPAVSIPTGGIYMLRDQLELSAITIMAYDKAGNYSTLLLTPAKLKINNWWRIIVLIIFIVLIYIIFKFFKKIKKKQVHE